MKITFFSRSLQKPAHNSLSKCPIKIVYFLGHFVSLLRKNFCNDELWKIHFLKRIWAYILFFIIRNSVGLVRNGYFVIPIILLCIKSATIFMGHFQRLLWAGFWSDLEKNVISIKDLSVHFVYWSLIWKKKILNFFQNFFSTIPPHYDSKNKKFRKKFFFLKFDLIIINVHPKPFRNCVFLSFLII